MTAASPLTDSIRVVRHRADTTVWWFHIATAWITYGIHLALWSAGAFLADTLKRDRWALAGGATAVLIAAYAMAVAR